MILDYGGKKKWLGIMGVEIHVPVFQYVSIHLRSDSAIFVLDVADRVDL